MNTWMYYHTNTCMYDDMRPGISSVCSSPMILLYIYFLATAAKLCMCACVCVCVYVSVCVYVCVLYDCVLVLSMSCHVMSLNSDLFIICPLSRTGLLCFKCVIILFV